MKEFVKHILILVLISCIVLIGIFLPYTRGDYDHFAVGLSYLLQFSAFTSLLLVPVGLIWIIMDFVNRRNNEAMKYPSYLRKIALVMTVIIIVAAALGAFASQSRFLAITILGTGFFMLISRKKINVLSVPNNVLPYYFIIIPLTVVFTRLTFLEKVKDKSTDFVIKQSELLIQDIEAYKQINGHYPVSLQSTIEDYHTSISGIPRFHYELKGAAYNIYFEQVSNMLGTEEIVMYNKLGEQEMTVHNQDLLRIPYDSILHGHHKVMALPDHNWKVFYFD